MRPYLFILMIFFIVGALLGCAAQNLNAPCPHFGASCAKVPVNRWDDNP